MRIAIALMGLALAGCAQQSGPTLSAVMAGCGYDTKPFVEAWPCVKNGWAAAGLDSDLRAVYVSSGDVASEQVMAGKMTDAEARLRMAQVRQNVRDAAQAREAGNPVADAIVLGSILNRPAAQPAPAPIYSAPRTVNCWRLGNSVNCY